VSFSILYEMEEKVFVGGGFLASIAFLLFSIAVDELVVCKVMEDQGVYRFNSVDVCHQDVCMTLKGDSSLFHMGICILLMGCFI